MKFEGLELEELLERSVQNLKEREIDFVLSEYCKMEDAMMALDLGNPRMDRALLSISQTPLFSFHPPRISFALKDQTQQRFMEYTLRCLCSWLKGQVSLAESLLTISSFFEKQKLGDDDLWYFVLGIWRIVDMTNELVLNSEVVKRDEFYFTSLHTRLPKEAAKDQNGLVLSHLQELESLSSHVGYFLRLVKLLLMLLTGIQLGQSMQVLTKTIIAPLKATLLSFTNLCFDEIGDAIDLEEIGVYPLLCNLVTIGCPKTNIKPPMKMREAINFLIDFLQDLNNNDDEEDIVKYLITFPFKTVLGRSVFAIYYQRSMHSYYYYSIFNNRKDENWQVIGMLLHAPSRQWRLLLKYLETADLGSEVDKMLLEHWVDLGKKLDLFEVDELYSTDSALIFKMFKSRSNKKWI